MVVFNASLIQTLSRHRRSIYYPQDSLFLRSYFLRQVSLDYILYFVLINTMPRKACPYHQFSIDQLEAFTDEYTDWEISQMHGTGSKSHFTVFRYWLRDSMGVHLKSYEQKHGKRKQKLYEPMPHASRGRARSYIQEGLDESYFLSIDSPVKAYWIGLLLADGWIVTEKNEPKGWAIGLQGKDKYLLEHLSLCLSHPYLVRQEREGRNFYQIKVTSSKMANDLIKAGIIPRKSKDTQMPPSFLTYPKEVLRGYFDGDGCAQPREAKFTCGTRAFLDSIQTFIENQSGYSPPIYDLNGKYGVYHELRIYGEGYHWFGKFLYSGMNESEPVCIRKRDIVLSYQGSKHQGTRGKVTDCSSLVS